MDVSNLKQTEASFIRVAIFEKSKDFPDHPFRTVSIPTEDTDLQSINIEGLKAGSYIIAVYQDLDLNEKLNKNWFGLPVEPYGFSNNIKPSITGLPLEKGIFNFPETKKLEIELR